MTVNLILPVLRFSIFVRWANLSEVTHG